MSKLNNKENTEEMNNVIPADFTPVPETPDNNQEGAGEQKKGKDLKILGMNIHVEKAEKEKKEKKAKKEKKESNKEHKVNGKKVAAYVGGGLAVTAAAVGTILTVAARHSSDDSDECVEDEILFLDAPDDDYPTETEGAAEETESVPVEAAE